MQAYGGSYSSVTSSGNICNEIGVMQFPCIEMAMSETWAPTVTVPKRVLVNDLSMYYWCSRVCTALETV